MAPFSVPAPCIIPLRLPVFGGPKSINTDTKIQLICETQLDCEIYYTLDGTKPQPYAGIVQGSKLIKYNSPFYLPAGKITIKAIAVNANIHTMCSSVVTKCYEVLKTGSTEDLKDNGKKKLAKHKNVKNQRKSLVNGKIQDGNMFVDTDSSKVSICFECQEKVRNMANVSGKSGESKENDCVRFDSFSASNITNCFEEAFIGGSEFETVLSDLEDSIEDKNNSQTAELDDDISVQSADSEDSESLKSLNDAAGDDCIFVNGDLGDKKEMADRNITLKGDSATSVDTQFCCMKCDMTLQHCSSCNRMNAVSSKYCIGCGKQLTIVCLHCKNNNPSVASFCQYCGKKLNSTLSIQVEPRLKVDCSVMARPQSKNVCIQKLPVMIDKCTQTTNERSPVHKSSPRFHMKPLPRHSPGRGYWHQQLDYICNHLKSHAYNHIEFRKEISEPTLCDFKSAHINKDENNVTVTIIFSPLETEKTISASVEIKSKDSS